MANKERPDSWQEMIKSLDKHWDKFKAGKDFWLEEGNTKLSHIRQVILKAQILERYYETNPEGDDRPKSFLKPRKIGLDIDEVLAGWLGHWCTRFNIDVTKVHSWAFDRKQGAKWDEMKQDKEFWLSIPRLIEPETLPFEPHCYITARSIPTEWTEEWLDLNGFPTVPVYSVGFGQSKVEIAKKSGIDVFVDDSYKNFVELNNAGILTYLYDAQHNQRYDVGHLRIKNLNELI